ncbi:HK97 family phage prohead protease [Methylocystis sp. SC2]|uniref:HK97 family phage prohead protease n=1 Tax=Methylocystis sp. (strain SC2) TaxID=187303 RepID=UPI00027AED60|nr:HK97 family phage prohead protease [Methylocystis sp. SC2]CCJ06934.1 Phage prohead protease, HK97 family [Methylocystis sp. SC2]
MAALRRTGAREVKRAELPLLQANDAGAFSGYASLFGVVDSGGDMVLAGAFARSLIKRGAPGVKMLWQHNAAEPIGVWTSIVEDARGLKVEGRLDLSVARAREALSLMRKGAIDGLSIGFRTLRATTEKSSGVRRLHEIDLWEISVVTFPMLSQARIGAVKQSRNAAPSVEALGAKLARLRARRAALEFARALRRLSEHS